MQAHTYSSIQLNWPFKIRLPKSPHHTNFTKFGPYIGEKCNTENVEREDAFDLEGPSELNYTIYRGGS